MLREENSIGERLSETRGTISNGQPLKLGGGGNLFASHVAHHERRSGSVCVHEIPEHRQYRHTSCSLFLSSSTDTPEFRVEHIVNSMKTARHNTSSP